MNATTASTDINLLPRSPRSHTRNGTNTASATPSNLNTLSMASAVSTQPTMMSRDGIALVPAASPARPAPWANFKPVFTSTQPSKLAAKIDSATVTTAIPAVSHTPEYAKEAGVFYDLTQNIEQGSIILSPAVKDEIHKWNLGTATERQTWRLGKLATVHARIRGKPDRALRRMPVLALRGFWPVADTTITLAGLTTNQVEDVVLPVPSEDAIKGFIFTLDWMCSIIYSKDCAFVKMPYINTLPTYRNFRVAQNARMLGMTDVMQAMLGRINDLRYKGQLYRPDVEDVKLVLKYIAPDHGIRVRPIAMIAQATLDKKLRNKKDINTLMEDDEGFGTEVEDAIDAEKKARAERKAS
ncbi:hypothetical protein LTR70_008731 [Exophiala xenobiotica]|uniref:Uncharacterized protein n=1 Tax=Lithohypha guttulata TaxID=1690604 RepID=A0ABR0K138_9EURO|nr:hypothetical protein LTR24_008585 [Lithohypha guttulata]KAK5311504.1 hypothetical protein LTR70_008731 [Exophiala xenobiotica]